MSVIKEFIVLYTNGNQYKCGGYGQSNQTAHKLLKGSETVVIVITIKRGDINEQTVKIDTP
jgi:hypothetical protein